MDHLRQIGSQVCRHHLGKPIEYVSAMLGQVELLLLLFQLLALLAEHDQRRLLVDALNHLIDSMLLDGLLVVFIVLLDLIFEVF